MSETDSTRARDKVWYTADDETVAGLPPKEKPYEAFFHRPKGFYVKVFPSGKKSFGIRYREGTKYHRHTIGGFGAWTAQQAYEKANALRRQVDDNELPSPHNTKNATAAPKPTRPAARSYNVPSFLRTSITDAGMSELEAARAMHVRAVEMYDEFIAARRAEMGDQ